MNEWVNKRKKEIWNYFLFFHYYVINHLRSIQYVFCWLMMYTWLSFVHSWLTAICFLGQDIFVLCFSLIILECVLYIVHINIKASCVHLYVQTIERPGCLHAHNKSSLLLCPGLWSPDSCHFTCDDTAVFWWSSKKDLQQKERHTFCQTFRREVKTLKPSSLMT